MDRRLPKSTETFLINTSPNMAVTQSVNVTGMYLTDPTTSLLWSKGIARRSLVKSDKGEDSSVTTLSGAYGVVPTVLELKFETNN